MPFSFRKFLPGWRDPHEEAEEQVMQAKEEMSSVRDQILSQLNSLKQEQKMHRYELEQALTQRVPQQVLLNLTKKCKQIAQEIAAKEKLLANVQRETSQLTDTGTNAKVAAALHKSVVAQGNMTKIALSGKSMDDILTEVDNFRTETEENTEFLADMGGLTDEVYDMDLSDFGPETVMDALGIRKSHKEDLMTEETLAMMQEHWQPRAQTQPINIPSQEANLFRPDSQYNTSSENLRQRNTHGQAYELPSAPGSYANNTAGLQETQGFKANRSATLAPPRTEY